MAQDNLKYFLINIMSYSFHVQSEKKVIKRKNIQSLSTIVSSSFLSNTFSKANIMKIVLCSEKKKLKNITLNQKE